MKRILEGKSHSSPEPEMADLARQALLRKYAPASVLTTCSLEILHFHGAIQRYLDPPADLAGGNLESMCAPELRPVISALARKVASDGEESSRIVRGVLRRGAPVDVHVSATPVREDENRYLLISFEDLADIATNAFEQALRESEDMHRKATDSIPVLISYCDADLRYRYCNNRYQEWFGIRKEEIVGKHIVEVIGEDAFAAVRDKIETVLRGIPVTFEGDIQYKNSELRHVRIDYNPRMENGRCIGYFAMIQDTSENHRARQQLSVLNEELSKTVDKRTEELRLLSENVPTLFAFVDRELRYRFVNRMFEQRFELKRTNIVGRKVRELFSPKTYSDLEPCLFCALGGEPQDVALTLEIPTHGLLHTRFRLMPRTEQDGSVTGVYLLIDDVSEERRLQHEVLTVAERENDRIGRDLHDSICQELAGIGMFGKALADELGRRNSDQSSEAAELVKKINEVTQKSRLLARGLSPVILENRTLSEALTDLAANVSELFRRGECRFHDRAEPLYLDESKATQLYLIAREAVFNATRHGRPSRIDIDLLRDSDRLALTVSDDGGGKKSMIREGLGIRSMRYRALAMGGSLALFDSGRGGLAVQCRIGIRS